VQQLLGYPYAEGWDQAPTERRRFLDWLTINGSRVLFLSGDIHVSELYRVSIGKDAFAWELTASALANGTIYADAFRLLRRNQRKWIVTDPNFCVVEIDIPKDDPTAGTVKFTSILASTGKIGAQSETTLATFGSTKRRRSFK
jgi:phosphodiesterase/alkaline phosphatase D-like protein